MLLPIIYLSQVLLSINAACRVMLFAAAIAGSNLPHLQIERYSTGAFCGSESKKDDSSAL